MTKQVQLFQVEIEYKLAGILKNVPGIKFYQVAADSFGHAAETALSTATLCGFESARVVNVRAEGEVLIPNELTTSAENPNH